MAPIIRIKKVVSTKFRKELMRRASSFRGAQVAARIQVPSDLSWWYWLEFGTAGRQLSDAPYGAGTSGTYPIDPIDREANGDDYKSLSVLHWGPPGGGVFTSHVDHPGIRPRAFVRQSLRPIMKQFAADVAKALTEGEEKFKVSALRAVLMEQTMVYALALIVQNLSAAAPGTREDGNLLGNSAADTFEEEAEIVSADDFSPGNGWTRERPPRTIYRVSRAKATRGQIISKTVKDEDKK